MDLNGDGKIDDGEQLLADVRVVTGSGRPYSLTDAQGQFILGDLPPGEHVICSNAMDAGSLGRPAAFYWVS